MYEVVGDPCARVVAAVDDVVVLVARPVFGPPLQGHGSMQVGPLMSNLEAALAFRTTANPRPEP